MHLFWGPTHQPIDILPIYGEMRAPKRWEDTIAPWFEKMDFTHGQNERSCFRRDVGVATCFHVADGDTAGVNGIFEELENVFKRKSPDVISALAAHGHLGTVVKLDGGGMYMAVAKYIEHDCMILKIEGVTHVPISRPVDTDSLPLSPRGKNGFRNAVEVL